MRADSHVIREVDGSVLVIRIANPSRKNALNIEAYRCLSACIDYAEGNENITSVLITGGDQYFCSGHDLEDFSLNPIEDDHHPVFQFMLRLSRFSKPVIAAVEGFAVGIGATLLLHCDLVYAGESSFFQMPFTRLGLCPEFAATFVIPQCAGHRFAAEMLMLGKRCSADRFREAGFINQLTADGKAFDSAMAAALEIAQMNPQPVTATKSLLKKRFSEAAHDSMRDELDCLVGLLKARNEQLG
ncbi:enoyl-CoA hydratase-related protein [Marinobacterium arenosum]|uniref:enoyl-CoA hydratase-related protein n=1 Tax=Marinobacterium arenosum TaxID=2862496 RepID=UPI001C98AB6F|nr:enoyl-CoA hydratase-related protein [Marinobacterium arenosum]MBY4675351.1 enoyl-CoA hydratase/isomerase family protein [Marinobacterium arenosum]